MPIKTLTPQLVKDTLRECGSMRATAAKLKAHRDTLARILKQGAPVTQNDERQAGPQVAGIVLRGVRCSTTKPADGIKKLLYGLKRGMGYPVEALSKAWNISPETIRKHARRFECLRYVEVAPGDWVSCVLNPDAATEEGSCEG